MVMHLLIMMVAAPLILFAARPMLVRWRPQIAACWLAGTLTVLLWHVPPVFEFALETPFRHRDAVAFPLCVPLIEACSKKRLVFLRSGCRHLVGGL